MSRLENNFEHFRKEDAYLRAQKRLKELKGFYGHAFWYVVVIWSGIKFLTWALG